jgi:hypothetical protein
MLGSLLALLLSIGSAAAGPTLQSAPTESPRPEVAAPLGGWWTEDGLYARVHAAPEDAATARRLAAHAARAVPRLAARLGVAAGGRLDIYVAPSAEEFARMQPGLPPDWADGTAWPRHGLVFLRAPSARPGTADPLEQVLDHEIVHVLVGRLFAAGGADSAPPRWLQEGLAQWLSGEVGPDTARALGSGGLLPLAELTSSFPADPLRARLAYASSADFVVFLASSWGEDAVRRLVHRMAEGADADAALVTATGASLAEVEAAWRADWADPLFWARVAQGSTDVLWGLAAVGLVAGAYRARARNRAVLARWEEEEAAYERRRAEALAEGLSGSDEPLARPYWVGVVA